MTHEPFNLRQMTAELRALTFLVTKTIGRSFQERLAKSGHAITPIQMGLMQSIVTAPQTISEISRMMAIDPSTLVPVVDTLEARGLVERRKDPADRRRSPLYLTDSGRQLLRSMMAVDDGDVLMAAIEQMGPEHTTQLRDLLRELLNTLPEGKETLCNMQEHMRLQAHSSATSPNPKS